MSTEHDAFSIEVHDHIAHLRLTRPDVANALGPDFWRNFGDAVRELDRSGEVRALVLSGEGKHFCSGMDLSAFSPETANTETVAARESFPFLVRQLQATVSAVEDARFPVIAAVHGACIGAGLDLVSACDLRVASSDVRFRVEEINIGMMADVGSLQRLGKLLPEGVVKELSLLGRTLEAERALHTGFVTEVCNDGEATLAAAMKLAQEVASKAPIAVSSTKAAIHYARHHTVADALDWAAERQAAVWNLADIMEAVRARQMKDEGNFSERAALKTL